MEWAAKRYYTHSYHYRLETNYRLKDCREDFAMRVGMCCHEQYNIQIANTRSKQSLPTEYYRK